ncbi:hypothetical protein PCL_08177 [Purpureocillium lilacinum]|uniref:Uncharacterized protein n=2 Tax=Purpureocillium lilacinum TaxID=33203 RepID=A0A2U3EK41_PURLI|nr:hypothetical protein Purlil1_3177 [Purpureocillium lilacinum]PWI74863.1 hypothetical protein PCL_08177 [Purpureocillium lilacinum]
MAQSIPRVHDGSTPSIRIASPAAGLTVSSCDSAEVALRHSHDRRRPSVREGGVLPRPRSPSGRGTLIDVAQGPPASTTCRARRGTPRRLSSLARVWFLEPWPPDSRRPVTSARAALLARKFSYQQIATSGPRRQ